MAVDLRQRAAALRRAHVEFASGHCRKQADHTGRLRMRAARWNRDGSPNDFGIIDGRTGKRQPLALRRAVDDRRDAQHRCPALGT